MICKEYPLPSFMTCNRVSPLAIDISVSAYSGVLQVATIFSGLYFFSNCLTISIPSPRFAPVMRIRFPRNLPMIEKVACKKSMKVGQHSTNS